MRAARRTAGCIDTDLPAVRRTLGRSDRFHIESAHAHHAIRVMSTETRCQMRSEEHTSELQSRQYLVCRLLLEKKKHNYLSVLSLFFTRKQTHVKPLHLVT